MIAATGMPTLRNPFPLPATVAPNTGPVATRVETFTNGTPTDAGARWLERNDKGATLGWHAEATNFHDAVQQARSVAQFAAKEVTVGDEGQEPFTSRYDTPIAVLQGTDGAWFLSRLADKPLPGKDAYATELASRWNASTPLDNVTYTDTAAAVKAIVNENAWFTPGAAPTTF
jgi:hypothetical protein